MIEGPGLAHECGSMLAGHPTVARSAEPDDHFTSELERKHQAQNREGDMKKLGNKCFNINIIGLIGGVIWWCVFYSKVN